MKTKIQEILKYKMPKKMKEMTEEEYSLYCPSRKDCFGIRNKEKHINIAVTYKKRPILFGRSASVESSLEATEKKMRRGIRTYQNIGNGRKTIDGKEMLTFDFQYLLNGKRQFGKYGLYGSPKYFISFEYICGEGCKNFAEQKYDELISSIKFKK